MVARAFFAGLATGILLVFLAMLLDASRNKPTLVWMDKDYKLHLVKKKRK